MPCKATTSHRKCFGGKHCVQNLKKKVFLALGYNLHLELASRCTFSVRASCRAKPRLRTQNASQNVRPETGKQHGLASSRTPFFDLRWSDLQCQTSRPEPIKKEDFAAVGLNLHLQLPSKCTVVTFSCVWASRWAKPRLLTQKPSQKGSPRNRETWPGELKDTVFRPPLE